MRRSLHALALLGLLAAPGCFALRSGSGASTDPAGWPFAGLNEVGGSLLGLYADRIFSGNLLEFEPAGGRLFAEAGRPGALSVARVDGDGVTAILETGEGSLVENFAFHPGGGPLYVVASTVLAENVGHIPLARALLLVDPGMFLLQAPIPLKPGGYSHGMALLPRRGLLFCLDAAGAGMTGGAAVTRVDLLANEADRRRPLGSLPAAVRHRGLAADERTNLLFALLAEGDGGSDFDPTPHPADGETCFLAALDPDSLTVLDRIPLPEGFDYSAVVPTPRGVLALGTSRRESYLVEVDARLGKQVGWVDLPEPVSDVAVAGRTAILPGANGLYIVDLDLFSLRGVFPYDLYRPGGAALAPDERTAAVAAESRDGSGRVEVWILDLVAGGVRRVLS